MLAAIAATAVTAGAASPAIAGAAGAGEAAAGAGAAAGGAEAVGMGLPLAAEAGASAAPVSLLGGATPLGIGQALAPSAGMDTPSLFTQAQGLLGNNALGNVQKAFKGYQAVQQMQPQHTTMNVSKPPGMMHPIAAPTYGMAQDAPPTTPYSQYDPQWQDWLRRHPQGAMA